MALFIGVAKHYLRWVILQLHSLSADCIWCCHLPVPPSASLTWWVISVRVSPESPVITQQTSLILTGSKKLIWINYVGWTWTKYQILKNRDVSLWYDVLMTHVLLHIKLCVVSWRHVCSVITCFAVTGDRDPTEVLWHSGSEHGPVCAQDWLPLHRLRVWQSVSVTRPAWSHKTQFQGWLINLDWRVINSDCIWATMKQCPNFTWFCS